MAAVVPGMRRVNCSERAHTCWTVLYLVLEYVCPGQPANLFIETFSHLGVSHKLYIFGHILLCTISNEWSKAVMMWMITLLTENLELPVGGCTCLICNQVIY